MTRSDDPALLHYRSGGFYLARATLAGHEQPGPRPAAEPARRPAATRSRADDTRSSAIPTSTSSRRPRPSAPTCRARSASPTPSGLARALGRETPWPDDAIVVCSFGDASANHSTATGALNAASYLAHRDVPCPVLFVCEDNRIGISTPSPRGWPAAMLASLPGVPYVRVDGADPPTPARAACSAWSTWCGRPDGRPCCDLDTVRFMGHAGSDVEAAYRRRREIERGPREGPARWRPPAACSAAGRGDAGAGRRVVRAGARRGHERGRAHPGRASAVRRATR